VYAASKAFVTSFGQALWEELAATGVVSTTVLPGYTRTRYFERVGLSPDVPDRRWMSSDDVARAALAGARQRRAVVIPGARDRYRLALATQFPSGPKGRAKRQLDRARQLARQATHAFQAGNGNG
jgi:hypothetical protein